MAVAGARSVVPVVPAGAVLKVMLLEPVPVAVPDESTRSPPFLSVAALVAPPD